MNKPYRICANRRRSAGFYLNELMCALFLVSAGLLGALQSHTLALEKAKWVSEYAIATRALANEIETLRALPFDALEPGRELPFRSATPELERLVRANATVTIADKSDDAPGLKQVRATVAWRGEHGRRIQKHLVTLVARK